MPQPSLLFILIDDMGWMDLTCQGSDFYETPNIDSLCRDGLRFSQAYAACPVCSPTRASLLTGKYPARVGLTNYIGGPPAQPAKGFVIDTNWVPCQQCFALS